MDKQSRQSPFTPLLPAHGETIRWERLYAGAKALALVAAARQAKALLVVLTPDIHSSQALLAELKFYLSGSPDIPIHYFPDWETLPYDLFSPYQDITSERLSTLVELGRAESGIAVVPMATAMNRLLPREFLVQHSLSLKIGDRIELEKFRKRMQKNGYRFVSQVVEHGDIAVRGSLLDIFPMGTNSPYRVDLFDEEIDSIRTFDPETQRSLEKVTEIRILPASEIPLDNDSIARFRRNWRSRFDGNPGVIPIYRDVSDGIAPAGIEYYLPLFYDDTYSIFDYLPENSILALHDAVFSAAEEYWEDIESRFEQLRHDVEKPILKPAEAFYDLKSIRDRLSLFPQIYLGAVTAEDGFERQVTYSSRLPLSIGVDTHAAKPLDRIERYLSDHTGRVLLVAETAGRRETILEMFSGASLYLKQFESWQDFVDSDEKTGLTVAPIEQGLDIDDPQIAVLSEAQLFGERVRQDRTRKRKRLDTEFIVRNLSEVNLGDPVVHEEHGIGRYMGLVTLEVNLVPAEFIQLEYDQGDKLYVPVSALDMISRYTGVDPEHAPLHRLGSGQWEKARRKAAEKVRDVAAELLELNARRASRPGQKLEVDTEAMRSFSQSFPFEETTGQIEAIEDVIEDMQTEKAMDRLICGDAGFGKTEVAMRAAFVAVNNGKQVAVLVPTTLLAQQHFQNFKDRFADWPVKIEVLSRFQSKSTHEEVMQGLEAGKVDIVIGTHKLLNDSIKYKRLGMVIIDEEHRFGVRQKEKFKTLRAEIDVLTLTATPIPRTLNLALSDLRDLSIIASPPSKRLAVKTFIQEWNDTLLREAVLREIKRGGQVYILHNKVENIESVAEQVMKLIPEARIEIAHGQMPEKQLESVMLDFYHRRFNVLVCTTIIETGIDVPTANTIIINRADKFGLAQLYQLRGRVGRSHHRAYAYLVVPPRKALTKDAVKRLEAIESLEELGIGFTLATHDLEIRGAGEILGEDQSGQIHEIGFSLYMELLERAVKSLKEGKQPQLDRPLDHGTEIDLHVSALIPDTFLPDVHTRLITYKRIASVDSYEDLQELQEELVDRFGVLPEAFTNLVKIARLKIMAKPLGIRKIDVGENVARIHFMDETNVDISSLLQLIQSEPGKYSLDGQNTLRVMGEMPDMDSRIKVITNVLDSITMKDAA